MKPKIKSRRAVKMPSKSPKTKNNIVQSATTRLEIPSIDIFGGEGSTLGEVNVIDHSTIRSNTGAQDAPFSSATTDVTYPHPLNFEHLIALRDISTHHSSCISTKIAATIGLGFYDREELIEADNAGGDGLIEEIESAKAEANEKGVGEVINVLRGNHIAKGRVFEELNKVTYFGFDNVITRMAGDFMDTGNGYLEVTRDKSDKIVGVNFVSAISITSKTYNKRPYYMYTGPDGSQSYCALFGKSNKEWLLSEDGPGSFLNRTSVSKELVSEIIPFMLPSNRVSYYGYPDWLSATPDIDLTKMAKQFKSDFYFNRGVMDYIISIISNNMDDREYRKLEGTMQGSVGLTRAWKSALIKLPQDSKVQVDKLAMENVSEDQFSKDMEVLSQNIVSAHRVPPLLANILIPGKLGANNEIINALIFFQLLVIGQYQKIISDQLARTLGDSDENDGLNLDETDFVLRTITSQINITGLDTVSRMRSEATEGNENGDRDMEDGVKE